MKDETRNQKQIYPFSDYFDLGNERGFDTEKNLRSYFGSVVKGQPEVYVTQFADGESTTHLLESWMEVLESISDKWPSLWEFENDLAAKVGPLSVRLPLSERYEDIQAYYDGIHLPSEPVFKEAINAVLQEYWDHGISLRIRSQSKTVDAMRLSTNSGSPYFAKRRIVRSATMPVYVNIWDEGPTVYQHMQGGYGGAYLGCAILGWRGQEGGYSKEDVKQRVVWMFPFAVNIEELRVYQPLIEAAQRFNIVPAWVSMDSVDREVTRLFDSKDDDDLIVCTDFTKFDQHFNERLQDAAATILAGLYSDRGFRSTWLSDVYPIKYMIPLAYNFGKVRYGLHGMGSGSGGTNADETLAHRALQYESAIKAHKTLNPHSMCLGDDGIISYPGITVESVTKAYMSHGLDMNLEKQGFAKDYCVYLRRWHHTAYRSAGVCVGVYSTCRALGRLRYVERYMDPRKGWDDQAVALRQLSILENVKWHPLKEQFVDFCIKRDKFRLGMDLDHFLDDVENIAKEKIDQMPDLLGYTKSLQAGDQPWRGISNWWIVKYLKSLM